MMTRRLRLIFMCLSTAVLLTATTAVGADLLVGPTQTYTTIQAAVDAASPTGDAIIVDAGTYVEQVLVDAKDLSITGAGTGVTILEAPASLASFYNDGVDHYPVLGIKDATVQVSALTVDGLGLGNLHERFHGVHFRNADGTLTDLVVTGVRNEPLDATAHGVGVSVSNDDAAAHTIVVTSCQVDDFQAAGMAMITAAGTALDLTLNTNVVTGAGSTDVIVQNGIQVTGGDISATLDGNNVADVAWTGATYTATGILLQDATGSVANSTLTGCQTGIHLASAAMTASGNGITVPRPTDFGRGIAVDNTDPGYAKGAAGATRIPRPYAPEQRDGRTSRATLAISVTGNTLSIDTSLADDDGLVGLFAENLQGYDDLDLTATGNTFTGFEVAIELSDGTPTTGTWLGAACDNNTFEVCATGLTTDLAIQTTAENCWWAALDGPGGDGPGSGSLVSGSVDYDPWRTDVLNLLCVPSSVLLTETATTDTVLFDYTGGASGRIYGYSIDVQWDPDVITATDGDFTRPETGMFATATAFVTQQIAAGHVRIDGAIGAFVPGTYADPLFRGIFELNPLAVDEASTVFTITVNNIRNNQNQPLAGLVPDPATITVDSTPVMVSVLVTDTTLSSTDWTGDGHALSIAATLIESSLDSLHCDLTAFGGPVLELADATVDGNTYTWILATTSGTGDGDVTADVTAVDTQAAEALLGDAITADNTPPASLVGMVVTPGFEKVHLGWTAPEQDAGSPLQGVEFRYAAWGSYPAYAGALPDAPADVTQGMDVGAGLQTGTSYDWAIATRDVYVLAGFVRDFVGNSSLLGSNGTATNYWLGDHDGDGNVDVFTDITALGNSYGLSSGDGGYDGVCDVGPTMNWSPRGIPNPQSDGYQVQFEDLMIFALNYSEVGPDQKSSPAGTPELRWDRLDTNTWVLTLTTPCAGLKGLNLRADLPDGVACQVSAGDLLGDQSAPVFLRNIAAHGLDTGLATVGPGTTIEGSGELVRVVFNQPLEAVELAVSARGLSNQDLMVNQETTSAPLPAAHSLAQNVPNPFNPYTTIEFALPQTDRVQLAIYAVNGRLVRTLLDERRPAGNHRVIWRGRDDAGRPVATGTYFYALRAGDYHQVRKMTLVK